MHNENYNINTVSSNIYNIDEPSPILELYRGKCYNFIINTFIYLCISNFGKKIFTFKKSYPRTITNLLSSWFFILYSKYNFDQDPFFPSNYENTDPLKKTLIDFSKYDPTINDSELKINQILIKLKAAIKKSIESIEGYKKGDYYKNKKNNYIIKKQNFNQSDTTFIKLIIIYPFTIKDKRLNNIIKNIILPINVYDKLVSLYTGPSKKRDEYIWILVFRYQLLGSNNNQLGVLPQILNKMNNDFGLNFELFASSINCTFKNYCSLYYDIEKYFGSHGSFFNIQLKDGTYSFNPPYQRDIIEMGINKIFNLLKAEENKLTFIITIPIWDTKGKNIMDILYPNDKTMNQIDYGDFEIINEIINNKYFKAKRLIGKNNFTYLDHNFNLYKNITIQHTYILIISNIDTSENFQDKLNNYTFTI